MQLFYREFCLLKFFRDDSKKKNNKEDSINISRLVDAYTLAESAQDMQDL